MKGFDCSTPLTLATATKFKSDGYEFVVRYLVPSGWKQLTKDEANIINQVGLKIGSVFETVSSRALGGHAAGLEDGKIAEQVAAQVCQPKGSTIYFAVDFDAQPSQMQAVVDYIKGASEATPNFNTGVYGSYTVIEAIKAAKACSRLWQTYAWSKGKKSDGIHVYQYNNDINVNGIGVDLDESYGSEGFWINAATATPTPSPSPFVPSTVGYNQVSHERVSVQGGKLQYINLDQSNKPYSITGTDVRFIKFEKGKYTLKLVWEKGKKVSELVKQYGADFGFNFPFFWDGNPVADCKIGNQILNQGYDDPNGAKQTNWHGLRYKNKNIEIGQFDVNEDIGADGFIVKTSPLLLNGEGAEVWDWYRVQNGTGSDIGKDANGNYVKAQRTFFGLDKDGNLLCAVGDGRTNNDEGLTLQGMALYMKDKGAVWALNGDGGSSSVIADQTGSLGQNVGVNERAVNHAILVFINKDNPTQPEKSDKLDGINDVVQSDWFADAIKYAVDNKLMSVDQSNNFNPNEPVTRAVLAQVIYNLKGGK